MQSGAKLGIDVSISSSIKVWAKKDGSTIIPVPMPAPVMGGLPADPLSVVTKAIVGPPFTIPIPIAWQN